MSDTLITIIAIFLAATLMFIVPLMSVTERNDDIAQSVVDAATAEFVDTVSNAGAIKPSDYEAFEQKLASTGNTYEIEIEVQVLDENPGKKPAATSGDLIGENIRYSIYTTEIRDYMYSQEDVDNLAKNYPLKKGDIIVVTVKNTNKTMAEQFRSFIFKVTGQGTYEIATTRSSMILNNGN
ncbi:MAG: hypothetical protein IJE59_04905 [Clostridia bacterium]|nr:hypothetical protein [Clostridia bacterium]